MYANLSLFVLLICKSSLFHFDECSSTNNCAYNIHFGYLIDSKDLRKFLFPWLQFSIYFFFFKECNGSFSSGRICLGHLYFSFAFFLYLYSTEIHLTISILPVTIVTVLRFWFLRVFVWVSSSWGVWLLFYCIVLLIFQTYFVEFIWSDFMFYMIFSFHNRFYLGSLEIYVFYCRVNLSLVFYPIRCVCKCSQWPLLWKLEAKHIIENRFLIMKKKLKNVWHIQYFISSHTSIYICLGALELLQREHLPGLLSIPFLFLIKTLDISALFSFHCSSREDCLQTRTNVCMI